MSDSPTMRQQMKSSINSPENGTRDGQAVLYRWDGDPGQEREWWIRRFNAFSKRRGLNSLACSRVVRLWHANSVWAAKVKRKFSWIMVVSRAHHHATKKMRIPRQRRRMSL